MLAGAATAGALIGFGLRHGTALQPFAAVGRIMFPTLGPRIPEIALAFSGAVVHFVIGTFWAWVAVTIVRRVRAHPFLVTTGVGLLAWLASSLLFPASLRALTAGLSIIQAFLYYTVLDLTLWGGIRLARMRD